MKAKEAKLLQEAISSVPEMDAEGKNISYNYTKLPCDDRFVIRIKI